MHKWNEKNKNNKPPTTINVVTQVLFIVQYMHLIQNI